MRVLHGLMASALVSILMAAGPSLAAEPVPEPLANALLWKIDGGTIPANMAPSYLYATIHLADPRMTQLSPLVQAALDGANVFVSEIKNGTESGDVIANALVERSQREPLDHLIGLERVNKLVRELPKRGVPAEAAASIKLWGLAVILATPKQDPAQLLNRVLQARVADHDIEFAALETAQEQMAGFDAMPAKVQADLLSHTLDTLDQQPAQAAALIEAYLQRDLDQVSAVANQIMGNAAPEVIAHFRNVLGSDRNYTMVERMIPLFQKNGAFIAVAALHMTGEEGIIALLREYGFSVTPVE